MDKNLSNLAEAQSEGKPTGIPVVIGGVSVDEFIECRKKVCKFLEAIPELMRKEQDKTASEEEITNLSFATIFIVFEMMQIKFSQEKISDAILEKRAKAEKKKEEDPKGSRVE